MEWFGLYLACGFGVDVDPGPGGGRPLEPVDPRHSCAIEYARMRFVCRDADHGGLSLSW